MGSCTELAIVHVVIDASSEKNFLAFIVKKTITRNAFFFGCSDFFLKIARLHSKKKIHDLMANNK